MEHEGKDCPDAHTQYDWNICLSKAVDAARKQFDVFYGNIMSILAPGEPADRPDRQRLLKDSQELWIQYRNATVKAIGEEWSTGTGRPSAEMQGELLLLRARMRELEFTYDGALHR